MVVVIDIVLNMAKEILECAAVAIIFLACVSGWSIRG